MTEHWWLMTGESSVSHEARVCNVFYKRVTSSWSLWSTSSLILSDSPLSHTNVSQFYQSLYHSTYSCHHLLTFMSFQTCMILILPWKGRNFESIFVHTLVLFCFKRSSKYLILCSTEERKSYRFGMMWVWVNDDWLIIFGELSL